LAKTGFLPVIERRHRLMTQLVLVVNTPATLPPSIWTLHRPTVRSFIDDH